VDKEEGITIKLDAIEGAEKGKKADSGKKVRRTSIFLRL
jgi:hypothetical protein